MQDPVCLWHNLETPLPNESNFAALIQAKKAPFQLSGIQTHVFITCTTKIKSK